MILLMKVLIATIISHMLDRSKSRYLAYFVKFIDADPHFW